MIGLLYSFVIFIATILGSSAGLGGGVIIKPMLDFIGVHDLQTISFLSTTAVFTMAVYATMKQLQHKVKIDVIMILLVAIGAMIGGNLGNSLFNFLLEYMDVNRLGFIQSLLLAGLLVAVLVNVNVPHKNLKIQNKGLTFFIGVLLGVVSAFLGIGGGPINVAVFIFFFSLEIKQATIYSIATILFSQGSKLLTMAFTTGFAMYDASLLWYTLPMALVGGIVGTQLNQKATDKVITKIFNVTVLCIILLNIYNAIIMSR